MHNSHCSHTLLYFIFSWWNSIPYVGVPDCYNLGFFWNCLSKVASLKFLITVQCECVLKENAVSFICQIQLSILNAVIQKDPLKIGWSQNICTVKQYQRQYGVTAVPNWSNHWQLTATIFLYKIEINRSKLILCGTYTEMWQVQNMCSTDFPPNEVWLSALTCQS